MRLEVLSPDLTPLLSAMAGSPAVDAHALTQALAANHSPPGVTRPALVLRQRPVPALGILAEDFDPAGYGWLDAMRRFLRDLPSRLRRLTYPDVEDHVMRLAARLRSTLSPDQLAAAKFVGLPRGGPIVLGMLAYALNLAHEQLDDHAVGSGPLVVVDDCAYSGARFGEYLAACDHDGDIVFACLLAPAPLCDAIVAAEERVLACLTAADMTDFNGTTTHEWSEGWSELLTARPRYWVGVTDHVCFPWSEPDWSYWDEASQRIEDGWSLLPAAICLEHRSDRPDRPLPIHVQPDAPGPYVASPDVLFARCDDVVVATSTGSGRQFAMEGVAADMWSELVAGGDIDSVVAALTVRYEVDERVLATDVGEFVTGLVENGLLVRTTIAP